MRASGCMQARRAASLCAPAHAASAATPRLAPPQHGRSCSRPLPPPPSLLFPTESCPALAPAPPLPRPQHIGPAGAQPQCQRAAQRLRLHGALLPRQPPRTLWLLRRKRGLWAGGRGVGLCPPSAALPRRRCKGVASRVASAGAVSSRLQLSTAMFAASLRACPAACTAA